MGRFLFKQYCEILGGEGPDHIENGPHPLREEGSGGVISWKNLEWPEALKLP